MMTINLLPKKPKRETLFRMMIRYRAINTLIHWHSGNIIKYQQDEINALKAILHLHNISV